MSKDRCLIFPYVSDGHTCRFFINLFLHLVYFIFLKKHALTIFEENIFFLYFEDTEEII